MKLRILLFALLAIVPVSAGELPLLSKQPWLGKYMGTDTRDFRFYVKDSGEAQLLPAKEKEGFISDTFAIRFVPLIEETTADGKVVSKLVAKDGWEAVTPATEDPKKITYRGKVAGDATFEVNIELEGGKISAGGKLLEKGALNNPRFVLRIQVPFIYKNEKDAKKLEEKSKKDKMELVRTDGKKLKLEMTKPLDAAGPEYSGPGLTQARIEIAGYGHRMDVAATPGGSFDLSNKDAKALIEGFTLAWKQDPAKDPEGKARFSFELK